MFGNKEISVIMKSVVNSNSQNLEMIPCPICGKPFPKKRVELGYPYCVQCSTEKKKVGLIEGIGKEGDSNEQMVIMNFEDARAVIRATRGLGIDKREQDEEAPEMRSVDAIESEIIGDGVMNSSERDSLLASLEEEFSQGMSEIVIEEMSEMDLEDMEDPKEEDEYEEE